MARASIFARLLTGIIFLVFGLNGFLHFLPMPPPEGVAAQFFGALFVSHYLSVIFLLQIIPAVLLLLNRYVPLALAILAPVIVNILCFHLFMARPPAFRSRWLSRSCGSSPFCESGPPSRGCSSNASSRRPERWNPQ
jgi:putative oxidoreductase